MALLTSIGVAGIPLWARGCNYSYSSSSWFSSSIATGVGIVYVVDRILDMTRTAINVFGVYAAVIIGKSEGETITTKAFLQTNGLLNFNFHWNSNYNLSINHRGIN